MKKLFNITEKPKNIDPKKHIEEIKNRKKNPWFYILATTICAFLDWIIISDFNSYYPAELHNSVIFATIFTTALLFILFIALWNLILDAKITACQRESIQEEIADVSKKLDVNNNLIETSYKYLDQYYLQTREHAQKGFIATVAVSSIGAVIIVVGIFALYFGKTTPAYVTTACGVLTEFIAAVYFYIYNKTIQGMNSYHNKLVLSQNIALALELSHTLENKKDDAKMLIIQELVKDVNTHIEK